MYIDSASKFCPHCGAEQGQASTPSNTTIRPPVSNSTPIQTEQQHGSVMEFLFSMEGRISRQQYASFFIGHIAISIITLAIAIFPVYLLLALYPSIAVTVKRSHDINKSGHFVWLCLIPLFGLIPSLMLLFIKGTEGSNRYGKDPLAVHEEIELNQPKASLFNTEDISATGKVNSEQQKAGSDFDRMFDQD